MLRTWTTGRRVSSGSRRRARLLDTFRDAVDVAEHGTGVELGKRTMEAILKGLATYGAMFDTLEEDK